MQEKSEIQNIRYSFAFHSLHFYRWYKEASNYDCAIFVSLFITESWLRVAIKNVLSDFVVLFKNWIKMLENYNFTMFRAIQ